MDFAPFDGEGLARRQLPVGAIAPSSRLDRVMARSRTSARGSSPSACARAPTNAMDYIRAVDEYLHQPEFRYVERPPQPGAGVAPLDFFLNDSHEGYCQHFAGAMALLLRMGGLPARVATGFTPGGYSERHDAWIVRDTDAHAWVEVWFDAYGWVTLDPTPAATPARSQVATLAAPPSSAPLVPDRGPGATTEDGGSGTQPSVRPELQVGSGDTTGSGADLRRQPRMGAMVRARRADPGRAARAAAVPAPPARQDVDGPRDRGGRGRDAPGRPAGHDGHDAGPAREPARLALAGGRGVLPVAGLGALRAGLGPAVTGGAAGFAPRFGAGARV